METLQIDRSKLKTVRSFALMHGVTVQQVYNWIKDKKVTEVVTNKVETVVTEQIETKVTEVIEQKIETGDINVNADAINYDTWD